MRANNEHKLSAETEGVEFILRMRTHYTNPLSIG